MKRSDQELIVSQLQEAFLQGHYDQHSEQMR